jgi:hypothetical protein
MNQVTYGCAPKSTSAYAAAQNALSPVPESLQVDESLDTLRDAVDFHIQMVEALLRRIEPATGELMATVDGCLTGVSKVPLALRVDSQRDRLVRITQMVQTAIGQLQI